MHYQYRITTPDTRSKCTVYIADQHQLLIFAFRKLVGIYPHLDIVGTSGSGLEAMKQCRKLLPSLVIVDPYLSEMEGVDFIRQIKRRLPDIRIIAYLSRRDEDKISALLDSGVDAVVDKSESVENLLYAIHRVNEGKQCTPMHVNGYYEAPTLPHISVREKQILKLIAEGQKSRGISELLSISVKTVESHRYNLMRKLGAHNIANLISWARKFNVA